MAVGELGEVAVERSERVVPAEERAQRVDADELRLGLGDGPPRHPLRPLDRAGGVPAPQPAAGGVVGVIRGQSRVALEQLLEQLAGVRPLGLVGAREGQHVGGGEPLLAPARQRADRLGETGLGRRPVLAAEGLRRLPRGGVLEERLQPAAIEGDRLTPRLRGRHGPLDRARLLVVIAGRGAKRGREQEGERRRAQPQGKTARDQHLQGTNRLTRLQNSADRPREAQPAACRVTRFRPACLDL